MPNLISIFRIVTEIPFESCQDAEIGDIAVSVCLSHEVPVGWTPGITENYVFNCDGFTLIKPIPNIIVFKSISSNPSSGYERASLKKNQIWYPRINCASYKSKTIVEIKSKKLSYRQPGIFAIGEVKGFVEWIVYTGATLSSP